MVKVRKGLKEWPAVLPDLAPRRITFGGRNPPDRKYSDATGLGALASASFQRLFSSDQLRQRVEGANIIRIVEILTILDTISTFRRGIVCRNLVIFLANGVARAASSGDARACARSHWFRLISSG